MCSPRAVHIPYTVETMIQLLHIPTIKHIISVSSRVGRRGLRFCLDALDDEEICTPVVRQFYMFIV